MTEKRNRNPNYTKEEQILLLNVLQKYKNTIENKKTDHVTWKEKDKAWDDICNKFNATSETGMTLLLLITNYYLLIIIFYRYISIRRIFAKIL